MFNNRIIYQNMLSRTGVDGIWIMEGNDARFERRIMSPGKWIKRFLKHFVCNRHNSWCVLFTKLVFGKKPNDLFRKVLNFNPIKCHYCCDERENEKMSTHEHHTSKIWYGWGQQYGTCSFVYSGAREKKRNEPKMNTNRTNTIRNERTPKPEDLSR